MTFSFERDIIIKRIKFNDFATREQHKNSALTKPQTLINTYKVVSWENVIWKSSDTTAFKSFIESKLSL